jgi:hypothetical protein
MVNGLASKFDTTTVMLPAPVVKVAVASAGFPPDSVAPGWV